MKKEHTCRVWGQPYWNEDDEVFDDLISLLHPNLLLIL
jgi:hypothetical protein